MFVREGAAAAWQENKWLVTAGCFLIERSLLATWAEHCMGDMQVDVHTDEADAAALFLYRKLVRDPIEAPVFMPGPAVEATDAEMQVSPFHQTQNRAGSARTQAMTFCNSTVGLQVAQPTIFGWCLCAVTLSESSHAQFWHVTAHGIFSVGQLANPMHYIPRVTSGAWRMNTDVLR